MGPSEVSIVILACVASAAAISDLHPLSDEFIDSINSQQTTWRAGRNFPHNMPLDYMKKLLGLVSNVIEPIHPVVKHNAEIKASLPENFDAREKWPICPSIGEIRDQGSCGSCWAFGAVGTMTDRVCIFSNGTKHFHFSAEDLVSCGSSAGSCEGGFLKSAFDYWVQYGIVSGGNYNSSQGCRPYSIPPCVHHAPNKTVNVSDVMLCLDKYVDTPDCKKTCNSGYDVPYKKDKLFGKKAYIIDGTEENFMAEIFLNGPIEVGFIVHRDFYNYKSGVYKHVDDGIIGLHAVRMIGWGVENDTKYWLVANSWNTWWGDKGFFKILRGQNECDIERSAVAGEPLLI